jgi:hypothetical protein
MSGRAASRTVSSKDEPLNICTVYIVRYEWCVPITVYEPSMFQSLRTVNAQVRKQLAFFNSLPQASFR